MLPTFKFVPARHCFLINIFGPLASYRVFDYSVQPDLACVRSFLYTTAYSVRVINKHNDIQDHRFHKMAFLFYKMLLYVFVVVFYSVDLMVLEIFEREN